MFKKLVYAPIVFILLAAMNNVYAHHAPLLVLDSLNKAQLPMNFRASSKLFATETTVSKQGLAELQVMGSSQFSEKELKTIMEKINAPILIMDLRQESHGFVDGNAISWYAPRDWGNLDKTPEQVERNQQQRLNKLKQHREITLNQITDKNNEGQIVKTVPLKIKIQNVMSEQTLAEFNHVQYKRLYVTDGWAPDSEQVDQFIKTVRTLPSNTWVYFHCRAGKGRTTTFMAMYDMLRNAKQISFSDIMQRQALLGGKELVKLPPQSSYKFSLAVKRVEFLAKFYDYCLNNHNDYRESFSAWEKTGSK